MRSLPPASRRPMPPRTDLRGIAAQAPARAQTSAVGVRHPGEGTEYYRSEMRWKARRGWVAALAAAALPVVAAAAFAASPGRSHRTAPGAGTARALEAAQHTLATGGRLPVALRGGPKGRVRVAAYWAPEGAGGFMLARTGRISLRRHASRSLVLALS